MKSEAKQFYTTTPTFKKHSGKRDTGPFLSSKPRDAHKLLQKNIKTTPSQLPAFCVFINPLPPKIQEGKAVSGGLAWEHS